MHTTDQPAAQSDGWLALEVDCWLAETGPRNPQASYYGARYYDPNAGRFLSEDPIRFEAGPNFYSYVMNNPISYRDGMGECPMCVAAAVGALTDIGTQLLFNGFNVKCINWKQVAVSTLASAAGVGLAQKLAELGVVGKIATGFAGPNRPTYRFLNIKNVLRIESHPIRSWLPDIASYPHLHLDAIPALKGVHLPLIEPLVFGGQAVASPNGCDECKN